MNRNIVILLSTFFLAFISCQNNTKQRPCNFQVSDSLWTITVNNGKGSDAKLSDFKPSSELLNSYIECVRQVDSELDYSMKYDSLLESQVCPDSLVMDSIGKWEDYDVYYISNEFVMLRSLLLKDCTGRVRLLYTESDHVGSPYSGTTIYNEINGMALDKKNLHNLLLPSIVSDSSKTILKLKHFVGGNKEYINEIHWKINSLTHIPERY